MAEGTIGKAVKVSDGGRSVLQIGNRDPKKARPGRRSAELGPFQLRHSNCMQFCD